jgi:hypothetical protein
MHVLAPSPGSSRMVGSAFARRVARLTMTAAALSVLGSTAALASSDPPGFAPVTLKGTQVIALNVNCFDHQVGEYPPNPCRGELMFHDAAGRELKRGTYDLQPGESMSLRLAIPATNAAGDRITRILIIPCIVPGEGRAVPSVEVFDRDAGRVVQFAHPAAARMSAFSNGLSDRGDEVAFDPQPDPPVFGPATLRSDQVMRMNVTCFNHEVVGWPPNPCTGAVMFHDAAGNVLRRVAYTLEAGQTRSFAVAPPASRAGLVALIPCIVPDPGGRIVPSVEVSDGEGSVALVINPAAARASQFESPAIR